jgi:putative membrane protein
MMGFGVGFGIVGLLLMVLLWGGLIALAVWLVRSLFPQATQPPAAFCGQGVSAREILDRRYARGEISRQEYDMKKEVILDEIE